jgi:AraC family transcriptional regulator
MELPKHFFEGRRLETLVENQTTYAVNNAEMHIFETHQQAEKILLQFNEPVLASMIQGKKVMHLHGHQAFSFLPGESLILPADEIMCIDFPEAEMNNPTRCSAMSINEEKITEVVDIMNCSSPRIDNNEWKYADYNFHFTNDAAINQIIQRLFFLFSEDHPSKDVFVDFMLKELIIRIIRANYKEIYTEQALQLSGNNRIAFVINYIRKNLDKPLSIRELSNKAYMSESHFHRVFKNELGISPVDFINNERIKLATRLLADPKITVKEVYMRCGFDSRSYFNRMFRKKQQLSPTQYQAKYAQEVA